MQAAMEDFSSKRRRKTRSGASKKRRRRQALDEVNFSLVTAAEHRDLDSCKRLLVAGSDPNALDKYGKSALLSLLRHDNQPEHACSSATQIAELLFSFGADVNFVYPSGSTLLKEAVEENNTEIAVFAIRRGADITLPTYWGRSIVHTAVRHHNLDILKDLVKQPDFSLEVFDNDGASPVYMAAEGGYVDIMELFAANCGKETVVNLANKTCGAENLTALSTAINDGESAMVKYFVDLGADPDVLYYFHWDVERTGCHPICLAAMKGFTNCLAPMLKVANMEVVHRSAVNPLCVAAANGFVECVRLLLQYGCNPNAERELIGSPGFIHTDFVRAIIQRDRCTPLKEATRKNHVECVKLLLDYGAKMTYDTEVQSPFVYALRSWSRTEIFRSYLANNVDINMISRGAVVQVPDALLTCLTDTGYGLGSQGMLHRLLDAGVNVNLSNWCGCKSGYSLIDTLLENRNSETDAESIKQLVILVSRYTNLIPSCCDKIAKMISATPGEVPTLQHLARFTIRSSMPPCFLLDESAIQNLPVPTRLKKFLAFDYKTIDMLNSQIKGL